MLNRVKKYKLFFTTASYEFLRCGKILISRIGLISTCSVAPMLASAFDTPDSIYADLAYFHKNKLYQQLYVQHEGEKKSVSIDITCVREYNDSTSKEIYAVHNVKHSLVSGLNIINIGYFGDLISYKVDVDFFKAVKIIGTNPSGKYRLNILIKDTLEQTYRKGLIVHNIDSLLPKYSVLSQSFDEFINKYHKDKKKQKKGRSPSVLYENSKRNIFRHASKLGLNTRIKSTKNKEIIYLYVGEEFLGTYVLAKDKTTNSSSLIPSLIFQELVEQNNQPFEFSSVMSRFREMKSNDLQDKELAGELSLMLNGSNNQETYSEIENNFIELGGNLTFPIMGIPVSFSGFYTSQDRNRKAKASYFHFRYDAEKALEQIETLRSSYINVYEQAVAKGSGINMIYGQSLNQIKQLQPVTLEELTELTGVNIMAAESFDSAAIRNLISIQLEKCKGYSLDSMDTIKIHSTAATETSHTKENIQIFQQEVEERLKKAIAIYEQFRNLGNKIEKYKWMLHKYNNAMYYDSLLVYNNIMTATKDRLIDKYDKSMDVLMPNSKSRKILKGWRSFDVGMFPNYVSQYTMSGQMIKGIDMSYNVGIADVGLTYGNTEYIDRSGEIESYKTYGIRTIFKPLLKQQIGLIYYGYSPSMNFLQGKNFFKDTKISLPSFRNPVHIISGKYKGEVSKYIHLNGEFAISNVNGQSDEASKKINFSDKSASNIFLDINIPKTAIIISGGYEHTGKSFENNTLPVVMTGTQRLLVKGDGLFLRSFLRINIEYNYMIQNGLYSKGGNSRWGFGIATHSNRYPNISLSYKPFSTFKTFDDTLNIEQKPIIGEVWTGRASYQIKYLERAVRFNLIFNNNISTMDTISYSSSTMQFNALYTHGLSMVNISSGINRLNTDETSVKHLDLHNNVFISISVGGKLPNNMVVNAGGELAFGIAGLVRHSLFISQSYTFKKIPWKIRTYARYSNLKLNTTNQNLPIYMFNMEVIWNIKAKLN